MVQLHMGMHCSVEQLWKKKKKHTIRLTDSSYNTIMFPHSWKKTPHTRRKPHQNQIPALFRL